jgi:fructoselysine-6-P-deglycase FrlB-like protein
MSGKVRLGIPSNSFAAGDLMINFPHYRKIIRDTIIIAPSRSGSTSEVVMSVKRSLFLLILSFRELLQREQ